MIDRTVPRVLQQWEQVELAFAHLLTALCEATTPAIARVYGGMGSTRARQQAVRDAAKVFFSLPGRTKTDPIATQSNLKLLLNNYKRGSELRNNVAHALAAVDLQHFGVPGFFLIPNIYATNKYPLHADFMSMTFRYNGGDLWDMANFIGLTSNYAADYVQSLERDYGVPVRIR